MKKKIKLLYEKLELIKKYEHTLALLGFDFETICPKDAREEEMETINYFSNELFKLETSKEYTDLIVDIYEHKSEIENPLDLSLIEKLYDGYSKIKNITPEFDLEMSKAFSEAQIKWEDAREAKDFKIFKDAFAVALKFQEEAIKLREKRFDSLYDSMLDDSEEGILQADLDPFFAELKSGLLELLAKIKNSKVKIRTDFLTRFVPIYKQEAFSKYLLELNGYDFNKGALSTTIHPFTSDIAQNDARVTTHYYENLFISNIYSVIHEGGHAIFMQNERNDDYVHYINDYITNGMHESVSRFYENIIGRSKEYIHLIYPKFKETFEEFNDVSEEELYKAVNFVEPSLIRTEADEVTYGLHIIIRYEMEKMILSHQISIDEIPAMWNKLYKDYLGVQVPNDAEGVLQDIHWTAGFGYFPSYALGNCYNAMYLKKIKEELPFNELIKKGDLKTVKERMKENVFIHANVLTPKEWIKEITGKSLTAKDFLEYLNDKYSEIYEF